MSPCLGQHSFYLSYSQENNLCSVCYLLLGGLVLFSSSTGVLTSNHLEAFPVFQSGLEFEAVFRSLTWFISRTSLFTLEESSALPNPGMLRLPGTLALLDCWSQNCRFGYRGSRAPSPRRKSGRCGPAVPLSALHHYSKSYVLGEQIRAQWKMFTGLLGSWNCD